TGRASSARPSCTSQCSKCCTRPTAPPPSARKSSGRRPSTAAPPRSTERTRRPAASPKSPRGTRLAPSRCPARSGGGAVPVSPAAEERALFGVARNDSLASRSSSATRLSKTVACDVEASLVRMAYA
ncbi:hypothetical protein EMIHUDRAFT_365482, partial [Emiliania huxleyi CCMP1516]|uniref:Uncharacterized protein n=2 Tax=Emiliania huxleyi TaxID=2903 RepID=A0A0D3K3J9_EMIH1